MDSPWQRGSISWTTHTHGISIGHGERPFQDSSQRGVFLRPCAPMMQSPSVGMRRPQHMREGTCRDSTDCAHCPFSPSSRTT